ncbi:MAG: xylulokinase [Nitrososphaerota archaeon]
MTKELLLGVDLGTMLIKGVAFTPEGEFIGSSEREVMVEYPKTNWAEQDPDMLWRETTSLIKELLKKYRINPHDIIGISLTGQMHGTFLVDKEGKPARNKAIIWLDGRTKDIIKDYYERGLADIIYDITGWRLITSMQLMHLVWLKMNEPETLRKAKTFMSCKDYIRYKMTGTPLMDLTDASVTGLMDIKRGEWSEEILNLTGLSSDILPEIRSSWSYAGEVSEEAARVTGLKNGTPIAAGAGDICASALGAGAVDSGQLTAIIGTAGIYELTMDRIILDNEKRYSVAYHAVPNAWLLETVQMTAGASLRWFRDELCFEEKILAEERGVEAYSILDEKAMSSPLGSNGLIFLPFMQGERSPFINPDARGVFFGLGLWTRKRDLIRAILEGVAFSGRDNIELFREKKLEIREVRLAGGGAKSALWPQIFSDVLGVKVVIPKIKECGALGAAIEAGVAAGVLKNPFEGAKKMIKVEREYTPSIENSKKYERIFKLYRNLYRTLWKIYSEASVLYSEL